MTGSESLMRRKSSCKMWMRKYFSMMWSSNKYFNSQNDFYELFIDPNASLFTQVENSLFFVRDRRHLSSVRSNREESWHRTWVKQRRRHWIVHSCESTDFLAIIVSIHTTGGSSESENSYQIYSDRSSVWKASSEFAIYNWCRRRLETIFFSSVVFLFDDQIFSLVFYLLTTPSIGSLRRLLTNFHHPRSSSLISRKKKKNAEIPSS